MSVNNHCIRCRYCKKRDAEYCGWYSGYCFSITDEFKSKLATLHIGSDPEGELYEVHDEADLALLIAVHNIDWHNFDKCGPGIYVQYFDDSCAYAMPEEILKFKFSLP